MDVKFTRMVFIACLFVFIFPFFNFPIITSAERNHFDISPKSEQPKKEARPDTYTEYQRVQEELWRDYQEIRNKLINDYISGKSGMLYEDFKLKEQSLEGIYLRGRTDLLRKYLRNCKRTQRES